MVLATRCVGCQCGSTSQHEVSGHQPRRAPEGSQEESTGTNSTTTHVESAGGGRGKYRAGHGLVPVCSLTKTQQVMGTHVIHTVMKDPPNTKKTHIESDFTKKKKKSQTTETHRKTTSSSRGRQPPRGHNHNGPEKHALADK